MTTKPDGICGKEASYFYVSHRSSRSMTRCYDHRLVVMIPSMWSVSSDDYTLWKIVADVMLS